MLQQSPGGPRMAACDGAGLTLAIAIKRAVDSLFRLPHVRGRRVREVRLSIAVQPVKGES